MIFITFSVITLMIILIMEERLDQINIRDNAKNLRGTASLEF